MSAIESIMNETRVFAPSDEFVKQANVSGRAAYDALCAEAQRDYAASDVLYLHKLKIALEAILLREDRLALAQSCFDFLPTRATLDLMGYDEPNDLVHH